MTRSDPQRPVLVAGGAGYIGSHTVRALQEQGTPVVVLDDLSTGHPQAVTADLEVCSLGRREDLAAVFEQHAPRSVIHFAARCYVGESVEDPARYYEQNVTCTWNLLQEMRRHGCENIVFSSTCATYGEPVEMPMGDTHPQLPISPYGRTKLHMEHMIEDFGRAYGLRWAALRYFNAAGAAQSGDLGEVHVPETHLIPLVLEVALGKREGIKIFGDDYPTPDGTCIRDYIHVEDLARAHLSALEQLEAGETGNACNLGTGTAFSVKQVIETAREVTGHPIPASVASRRAGDPPELTSGGTRARELLDWEPRRSGLRDIVSDAWRFLQAHPEGYTGGDRRRR